MYVHIGGSNVVRKSEIIGIFDFDTATVSRNTKKFLKNEEKKKQLENAFHDMPRSFILTKEKTVVSELNTATVKSRINKK